MCSIMAPEVEQLDTDNRQLLNDYFIETQDGLSRLFTDHGDEVITPLSAKVLAKSLMSCLEGALLLA